MSGEPAMRVRLTNLARRLVIVVLAGLLIFYHIYTLAELYLSPDRGPVITFDHIQSVLRAAIVASLLLVAWGTRRALWGMWIGIGGLIATQYWAHFGDIPVDFTEGRHPLSYLKGFIFPTVITLCFPRSKVPGATVPA